VRGSPVYGGLCWAAFGLAGILLAGTANPSQPATYGRLVAVLVAQQTKGVMS